MNTNSTHISEAESTRGTDSSAALGQWETAGSVLWFTMDSAWMAEFLLVAQLLIVPALLSHLVTLRLYATRSERLIGGAAICWITMNIFWMLSEIHNLPGLLSGSKTFSVLGFACLLLVIVSDSSGGPLLDRLRRFRRMKVRT
jgi:hypothetical protein